MTLLLSVAALATSWGGYQAARWGSFQASKYSEANGLRIKAADAADAARLTQAIDIGLFNNWLNSYAAGKTGLTTFYRRRFRDEFKPAFEIWLGSDPRNNPDAASSPFVLPEYRVKLKEQAAQFEADAARAFQEAQTANEIDDRYVFATLMQALVLFFAGISQQIRSLNVRMTLTGVAALMCLFAMLYLTRLPLE